MSGIPHDDWYVVEGIISDFRWSAGHENLLTGNDTIGAGGHALAAGAAAVVDMYGTAAGSAAVALYDGEYTENCAFKIEEEMVLGTFCGAHKLQDGDDVKLVVSRIDEKPMFAHAIQRKADGLLWLPSQVNCGTTAALNESIRTSIQAAAFGWLLFSSILIAINLFGDDPMSWGMTFSIVFILAFVGIAISFGTTFLPGRPNRMAGETGSRIFSLLAFPNADVLRMDYARLTFQNEETHVDDVYMYELALDAMERKAEILTKFDSK